MIFSAIFKCMNKKHDQNMYIRSYIFRKHWCILEVSALNV